MLYQRRRRTLWKTLKSELIPVVEDPEKEDFFKLRVKIPIKAGLRFKKMAYRGGLEIS